jgi:Uma2 family endonuclease
VSVSGLHGTDPVWSHERRQAEASTHAVLHALGLCTLGRMEARELKRMSVAEYVALDRGEERRFEYAHGEAFAMAGASLRHNAIAFNIAHALQAKLASGPCRVWADEQKIETAATRAFHYPDASVVCGRPTVSADDENAITNPSALFEVLSESTGDYDRGGKFDHYRTIAELRDYVLVFPDERRVEHRKRVAADQWLMSYVIGGGEVVLEGCGVALSLDEVYADLDRTKT